MGKVAITGLAIRGCGVAEGIKAVAEKRVAAGIAATAAENTRGAQSTLGAEDAWVVAAAWAIWAGRAAAASPTPHPGQSLVLDWHRCLSAVISGIGAGPSNANSGPADGF